MFDPPTMAILVSQEDNQHQNGETVACAQKDGDRLQKHPELRYAKSCRNHGSWYDAKIEAMKVNQFAKSLSET